MFELVIVSLDDNPKYTALSYVWGKAVELKPVTVNEQEFLITQNLDIAFRHLQYADFAPALWVDSVCINQADNAEKTDQVRRMGSIFGSASRVINWLGGTTQTSDYLAEVVHVFANEYCKRFKVSNTERDDMFELGDFDSDVELVEFLTMVFRSNQDLAHMSVTDILRDLITFVSRTKWWYRVWMVQEFALARKTHFQVGLRKMEVGGLATLICLTTMLSTFAVDLRPNPRPGMNFDQWVSFINAGLRGQAWILQMMAYRERYQSSKKKNKMKLADILIRSYVYLCPSGSGEMCLTATDKRDFVYGLLSLVEESRESLGFDTDYRRTWEEVYGELALCLIKAGYTDILSLNQKQIPFKDPKLPSWAPNWHKLIISPNIAYKCGTSYSKKQFQMGNSLFSASLSRPLCVSSAFLLDGGHNVRSITFSGILVDEVLDVGSVYLRSWTRSLADLNIIELCRELQSFIKKSRRLQFKAYSSSIAREAVWRILIKDLELPDTDNVINLDSDDEIGRATQLSRRRFSKHLPLFRAIEVINSSKKAIEETTGRCIIFRAFGRARSLLFKLVVVLHILWYLINATGYNFTKLVRSWLISIVHFLSMKECSPLGTTFLGLGLGQILQWNDMAYWASIYSGPPVVPFITQRGYVGLAPGCPGDHTRPGDLLCIFYGVNVPYVLRPRAYGERGYILVGEAFAYGAMDGELIREDQKTLKFEIF